MKIVDTFTDEVKQSGVEVEAIKSAQKISATTLQFSKTDVITKTFTLAPSYFYSATWTFTPKNASEVPVVHFEFASGTSASIANGGISTIKKIVGNNVQYRVISLAPGSARIIANSNTKGELS